MVFFRHISAGGLAKETLLRKLSTANVGMNEYALKLLNGPSFKPESVAESFELMKVSVSDLGLQIPCSYRSILETAAQAGLSPCPLHLAAFLRLEYLDQPEGPYLTIASAPAMEETLPNGFYLRNHQGTLWLRGYRISGDVEWPPGNEFIFRRDAGIG